MHAQAPWRHPQASHTLVLQGVRVDYVLQWAQRRSTGLRVTPQGLQVRAPRWIGLGGVEAVLREKAGWILRQLHTQALPPSEAASAASWQAGMRLPYLGGQLLLQPASGLCPPGLHAGEGAAEQRLSLCVPAQPRPEDWQRAAWAWWQAQAWRHFRERLDHFAPQMGVQWRALQLSQARTRWGSAHADGGITLNVRLLHCAPTLVDYVVVHELAHLRVMDHSPRFWAVVAQILPDHLQRRRALPRLEPAYWSGLPLRRSRRPNPVLCRPAGHSPTDAP